MPNIVNTLTVREYDRELKDAEGVLLCAWHGLSVSESDGLRGAVAEKGARMRMVRNSLVGRVLAEKGMEIDPEVLTGNVVMAYGTAEQTIGAAKVLTAPEIRRTGKIKLRAGLLEGRPLDAAQAVMLADIPDRQTLSAQLLGVLLGPARGLATVLNAPLGAIARVLQARVDRGDGAGAAEEGS